VLAPVWQVGDFVLQGASLVGSPGSGLARQTSFPSHAESPGVAMGISRPASLAEAHALYAKGSVAQLGGMLPQQPQQHLQPQLPAAQMQVRQLTSPAHGVARRQSAVDWSFCLLYD
jgi:hypothetical protein